MREGMRERSIAVDNTYAEIDKHQRGIQENFT